MWQRWGNKTPAISHPTQFTELDQDDVYEERYLETIPEVESISSKRQSVHAALPELPLYVLLKSFRDDRLSNLVPSRAVPPMRDISQPVNVSQRQPHPFVSSHKDQGLRINVHAQPQDTTRDEVSPLTPRAPDESPPFPDEPPVSPIEPIARAVSQNTFPPRPFQSQIPRKVVKQNESGAKEETKWDEYSGEPTSDETGKPSSVRPGVQPLELQYPQLKERTKQILAGLRERDTSKNLPWGRAPPPVGNDPLDQPVQRAPWKGASGRAAIVAPVQNTPSARKGPLPRPTTTEHQSNAITAYEEPTSQIQPAYQEPQPRPISLEEEIRPTAPLKIEKRVVTPELVTKTVNLDAPTRWQTESSEPFPVSQEPFPDSAHRAESPQHDEEPRTPDTPIAVETLHVADEPKSLTSYGHHEIDPEQSRFSWTTYTTSAVDSPRSVAQVMQGSSPPPPMPDFPPAISIKKRPVSSSPFLHSPAYSHRSYADSTASVVRKPLPGGSPNVSSTASPKTRAMSTSKSLPPTPTVLEASDKIENFHAQLEALERRKHNINRIITDLEGSLKKNAIVYDMWKRKEVEKNITNHRMELDDIGRDIHDLNFILHRAQRKRDREDGYEACTGLWIKRVTS